MSNHHANHGYESHTPETSHGSSGFFSKKNVLGAGALIGGTLAYPQAVTTAVHTTAGAVQGALDITTGSIATGAHTAGASFIGSLAPLLAPAAAGYYIADKLTKWSGVHNKYARIGLNLAGGVLGAGVAGSAAMPYLVGGTLAYAVGRKPFVWALDKIGSSVGAVYDAAVAVPVSAAKAALSIPKGVWNATKNGFGNPTLWPNTVASTAAAAH